MNCKLCGKEVKSLKGLGKHLTMSHKDTSHKDYYTKYLMVDKNEEICPYCKERPRLFRRTLSEGFATTCGSKECVDKANSELVSAAWDSKDQSYWDRRQEKARQTNLKKYGVEHHTQDPSIIEKRVKTNLERFGAENNSQTQQWRDKIKETSRVKYGVDHWLSSPEIIKKRESTNLEEYGVRNVFQVEDVKEKIHKSLQEKYGEGIINPTQAQEVKDKVFTDEWRAKIRVTSTKIARAQGVYPRYNERACIFFESLNEVTETSGQHALNGGEYLVDSLGYYLDYINHELKLIIEWDESYHYDSKGRLREKDTYRQQEIQELYPDYSFIRIKEDEASSDPTEMVKELS